VKPETRREEARNDLASRCLEARKSVVAFLDWAGFNDSFRRSEWEAWATRRIHDGWTAGAVHERVKEAWIEHRRERGRPVRADMPSREDMARLVELVGRAAAHMGDFAPCEPWWERVGQPPGCHDWENALNRNRQERGLPPGPPWTTGHEAADRFWNSTKGL
jgi:hypothetical protein